MGEITTSTPQMLNELRLIIGKLTQENQRLRDALERASHCCARPRGVCLDPHWFDGDDR